MSYNVAVDGPAGAGKSTIARAVAARLNLIYVDTGAMYRALTLYLIREGVDLEDEAEVIRRSGEPEITLGYEQGCQKVYLNGEDVSGSIRTEEVGIATARVSALGPVREGIVAMQKALAARSDCIMDGRDIGTCVLPDADVKIYLTASSQVRAKRRYDELTAKGLACDYNQIKADIEARDYQDMHRQVSPLRQAEDAVLVDTSQMTVEEVVEKLVSLCGR